MHVGRQPRRSCEVRRTDAFMKTGENKESNAPNVLGVNPEWIGRQGRGRIGRPRAEKHGIFALQIYPTLIDQEVVNVCARHASCA